MWCDLISDKLRFYSFLAVEEESAGKMMKIATMLGLTNDLIMALEQTRRDPTQPDTQNKPRSRKFVMPWMDGIACCFSNVIKRIKIL